MRGRSRYANRYDEFQQDREPISLSQAEIVGADSYLLNIANGQCGGVRVSCWPTPEGAEKGRRWGKLGAMDVVILPFRTRAGTASPTTKLDTFELELFLCESDQQGFGPPSFPKLCHEQRCGSHAAIALVDLPAPEHVAQRPTTISPTDSTRKRPWIFRSEEIQNCDGLARAARWTWDANGHEPVVLHGGLAFKHVGEPFFVACRVRGKASVGLPNQSLRIRYQFSNEENTPRWWAMIPQKSSEDLSQSVQQLEATMQSLNTIPLGTLSSPAVADINRSQSHNFGGSTISGPAHVVMGDVHLGHKPHNFQQDLRSQQLNTISQTMSQMIE